MVETGTRGLLGAVVGGAVGRPGDRDEIHLATRLLPLLHTGMLLLADRAYDSGAFLAAVHATGAHLLVRGGSTRKPPVLTHLPDGSYLSEIAGLAVRIIEAEVAMRGADGTQVRDSYRLITTLLEHHRYPATVLIGLYHERWEIESALLTLYQLLRTAMVEAIESRPGLDPDRASFTTALQTARDQLVTAAGIHPDISSTTVHIGVIGHAVLATLLPARRMRCSNRNVKCYTSRYHARDDGRPDLPTTIVGIDILVRTPPINPAPLTRRGRTFRHRPPRAPRPPRAATRRDRVTAILLSEPRHDWHGHELAELLGITLHNLLTQLAEWARLGFIERTGKGTYALDTSPPGWPPPILTNPPTRVPLAADTPTTAAYSTSSPNG